MLTVLSAAPFLKDIMLAIEKNKSFATLLNNINALNLAVAIDSLVGNGHGLHSAHLKQLRRAAHSRSSDAKIFMSNVSTDKLSSLGYITILLSAHATVSVNQSDLTQLWPNKM